MVTNVSPELTDKKKVWLEGDGAEVDNTSRGRIILSVNARGPKQNYKLTNLKPDKELSEPQVVSFIQWD